MRRLQIRDLSKTYPGGVRALRGISLAIPAGVFGLLGPNGAGKSTLMRTIATLQEPDEGTVLLDGVDVTRRPDHVRRRLGYLPQEFGVYPNLSARRLLDHMAILKGVGGKRERARLVDALLERTGLAGDRDRAVSDFSGGMRQRFGIAQALLGAPELIVVDEPTAGLDPGERVRFHDLLGEVGEEIVVLLSTHIVEDVANLCPRMAVLDRGSVVLEGDPSELTDRLAGRLWRRTVDRSALEEATPDRGVVSRRPRAGRIEIRAWSDARPGDGFEPAEPDLEDLYFLALDGEVGAGGGRAA